MLLNPAQQAAVVHRGGPLLVLAGAGTGKTRVITHRVASLLAEGVPPWQILAVTFTNKAAAEMRERIATICSDREDIRELWVGTFHSICARILRRHGGPVGLSPRFAIYDTSDQLSVMKRVFKDLNIGSGNITPQAVLGTLDRLKNQGYGIEGLDRLDLDEPLRSITRKAGERYERLLRAADGADFGDLLVLALRLLDKADMSAWTPRRPPPTAVRARPKAPDPQTSLPLSSFAQELAGMLDFAAGQGAGGQGAGAGVGALVARSQSGPEGAQLADLGPSIATDLEAVARLRRRFRHIVVDEFQDTNPVQAAIVDLLSTRAELCVVGDDDQSIYGWRGADVAQILTFPERHGHCEVIRLEENYRSTTRILDAANAIIRRNTGRHGKTLRSSLGEGDPIRILTLRDEVDEARTIATMVANDLAEGVPASEIAVFYRTHALSRALEEALIRGQVRYQVYGGLRFFDRKEIKDLLAYLRLVVNPRSDVDLDRVINVPARGIGKTSTDRLKELANARGISLYETLAPAEAEAAGLTASARRRVIGFRRLLDQLIDEAEGKDLGELAAEILDVTGYRLMLAGEESDESRDRLENLQEFVGELSRFSEEEPEATLSDYLEQVALLGDADGGGEEDGLGAITLMTIHSAKGLEFQRVYLTGMEERVFPHARVLDDPAQMEEERRLAYVAVTRAKRRLTITWTQMRRLYGQAQVGTLSRFVREIPASAAAGLVSPAAAISARAPVGAGGPAMTMPRAPAPEPEPAWDDDIVYDDDEAAPPRRRRGRGAAASEGDAGGRGAAREEQGEAVSIYVGMRVRHARFGEGEVLGWAGLGDDLKLNLRFREHGTKTILARFCQPV